MAINSLSSASYGYAGLASGINTQEIVEKLLSGTQVKIDKAGQNKSVLQFKQSMYQDVASRLKTLQNTFLSFTSKSNLNSTGFYNSMNATVSTQSGKNALFSVTATNKAVAGEYKVDYVKQLAKAYSAQTTQAASSDVKGVISQGAAQQLVEKYSDSTLKIQIGDATFEINDVVNELGGQKSSVVVEKLQAALGSHATVDYVNGKLDIKATNPDDYITITGSDSIATQMFGTGVGLVSGKGSISRTIDTNNYLPSFDIELDGKKQTIQLDFQALKEAADGNFDSLVSGLQSSLKKAFGDGLKVEANEANGQTTLTFKAGATSKFTVTGNYQATQVLGLRGGVSNKLSTGTAIGDLNFATELQGNRHTFSINGVEFSYTADTSLSTIMSDIEKSNAGVRIVYDEAKDRFKIESKLEGKTEATLDEHGNEILAFDFEQTEGNLLTVLFGEKSSGMFTGTNMTKDITGGAAAAEGYEKGGVYTFTVDGRDYKITIPEPDKIEGTDEVGSYTIEEFQAKMDEAFEKAFGKDTAGDRNVEFLMNENGDGFKISVGNSGKIVTMKAEDEKTNKSLLGFNVTDTSKVVGGGESLADTNIVFGAGGGITIAGNGDSVTLGPDDLNGKSMDDIAGALTQAMQGMGYGSASVSFDEKTAAFRIMGVDIPMEIVISDGVGGLNTEKLFGQDKIELATEPAGYGFEFSQGTNAIISINEQEYERQSNSFTIDGLTFQLNSASPKDENGDPVIDQTTIGVTRDTDSIYEAVEEFFKLYNETVEYINSLYRADPTYKDYAPLTAAQKSEMSEREIELWEEKSKEGLLRSDSTLDKILQSMRNAMYTRPEGSSIAIYDLGMSTSFYAADGVFVESDPGALKAMIESDPDAVRQLLSGTGGIMETLNNAIEGAIGSAGSLTNLAGKTSSDYNSTIAKQIREVDSQVSNLELRYQSEYNRYWKQFNAMEQMIQQMNSQSSWLSQQLG